MIFFLLSCSKDACQKPACYEKTVTLTKEPYDSLGMTVAGGMSSRGWDLPIYVTNVDTDGVVAQEGSIRKGKKITTILVKWTSWSAQLSLLDVPDIFITDGLQNSWGHRSHLLIYAEWDYTFLIHSDSSILGLVTCLSLIVWMAFVIFAVCSRKGPCQWEPNENIDFMSISENSGPRNLCQGLQHKHILMLLQESVSLITIVFWSSFNPTCRCTVYHCDTVAFNAVMAEGQAH